MLESPLITKFHGTQHSILLQIGLELWLLVPTAAQHSKTWIHALYALTWGRYFSCYRHHSRCTTDPGVVMLLFKSIRILMCVLVKSGVQPHPTCIHVDIYLDMPPLLRTLPWWCRYPSIHWFSDVRVHSELCVVHGVWLEEVPLKGSYERYSAVVLSSIQGQLWEVFSSSYDLQCTMEKPSLASMHWEFPFVCPQPNAAYHYHCILCINSITLPWKNVLVNELLELILVCLPNGSAMQQRDTQALHWTIFSLIFLRIVWAAHL